MKELPPLEVKGRWLKTVRSLFRKETKVEIPKLKVLVEGANHDSWRKLDLAPLLLETPPNCTKINFGDYYLFTLVGRWDKEGIKMVNQEEIEKGSEIKFNDAFKFMCEHFERPRTIITEDGRIYHDLILLESQVLKSFLDGLYERYGKNNPAKNRSLVGEK